MKIRNSGPNTHTLEIKDKVVFFSYGDPIALVFEHQPNTIFYYEDKLGSFLDDFTQLVRVSKDDFGRLLNK